MDQLIGSLQGEFMGSPDPGLANLEAQKLWLDGGAVLAEAKMLLAREKAASNPVYQRGDKIEVWSVTCNKWFPGKVDKVDEVQINVVFCASDGLKKKALPIGSNCIREARKLGLNGAAALAQANSLTQANMLLARENMLLHAMQDNARLAHENRRLRMQTSSAALKQSPSQGKTSAYPMKVTMLDDGASEVSTDVGSSPPGSWTLGTSDTSSPPGSWTLSPPGTWTLDTVQDDDQQEEPLPAGTSVMMRNLPNDYTRSMLLELLRTEGFEGDFDFVYLPVDFQSCSGLGYAFINFLSLDIAERFRQHFSGFNRWSVASDKTCKVTWSALQGLEAHTEHFRNSTVMHESVPEEQKPALFEGLERVPFPAPTRKIRMPRHWHRRH